MSKSSSRYRKIAVSMYGDAKFAALSKPNPNGQSLWIYLLTGPHTTAIPGLSVSGEAAMAEALGWGLEAFRRAFREVFEKGMAKVDWRARVVWLPNALKYNPPESPNVIKGWRRAWDEVPECRLKDEALVVLKDVIFSLKNKKGEWCTEHREAFRKAFPEAFREGFAKGVDGESAHLFRNQEQEQEQEQDSKRAAPSADEIGDDGKVISAETVYRAYPKHVEPEPSRKSISDAVRYLRKQGTPDPWAWLLGRVRMYADARAELERKFPGANKFIPACHRWMKRKRYEEDPAIWPTEEPGFAVSRNGTVREETPAEYARRVAASRAEAV